MNTSDHPDIPKMASGPEDTPEAKNLLKWIREAEIACGPAGRGNPKFRHCTNLGDVVVSAKRHYFDMTGKHVPYRPGRAYG